jgi:hypothetical protein
MIVDKMHFKLSILSHRLPCVCISLDWTLSDCIELEGK